MRTLPLFTAFAAAMLLGGMVCAVSVVDSALTLANVSVSPNPVVAGGNAVISFRIYNSYDYWLYNVNLQPQGSYPLLNASPLVSTTTGVIDPGLNSGYFNYTIGIPSTIPSGTYTLTFAATYYAYSYTGIVVGTSTMPVSFYVQNKPIIKVVTSSPQPAALYSGYNQTVDLAIENTGYGTARNVSVAITGVNGTNVLSSVTTFFISNLTSGSSVTKQVLVTAKSIGNAGLLANVSYHSASFGQTYSSIQKVNLSVAPAAQFSIAAQSSANIVPGATDVPISFRITNTGTSDATQVQLNLETSYPITPVASTAYINDLPAGASVNVSFMVSADGHGVPGNYPVTLYERWKQPNGAENQQFSGSNNYFVAVHNSAGAGLLVYVAVAAVIVVVAVAAYKKTRHKKRK